MPFPPAEAVRRLNHRSEPSYPASSLVGHVGEDRVLLTVTPDHRSSFTPVLDGRFEADSDGGARLIGRIRLARAAVAFTALISIILLGWLSAGIQTQWLDGTSRVFDLMDFGFQILMPSAFLTFVVVMMRRERRFYRRSRSDILRLVGAALADETETAPRA